MLNNIKCIHYAHTNRSLWIATFYAVRNLCALLAWVYLFTLCYIKCHFEWTVLSAVQYECDYNFIELRIFLSLSHRICPFILTEFHLLACATVQLLIIIDFGQMLNNINILITLPPMQFGNIQQFRTYKQWLHTLFGHHIKPHHCRFGTIYLTNEIWSQAGFSYPIWLEDLSFPQSI